MWNNTFVCKNYFKKKYLKMPMYMDLYTYMYTCGFFPPNSTTSCFIWQWQPLVLSLMEMPELVYIIYVFFWPRKFQLYMMGGEK